MTGRLLLAVLLAALAWPASAAATLNFGLSLSGDPLLNDTEPPYLQAPDWWICSPGEACRTLGYAAMLEPGHTRAGTVFELAHRSDGADATERSPAWLGRVVAKVPPALEGDATPGGTVWPLPATWTGGWGSERSAAVVLACPALARTDCEVLAGPLQARHRGWLLYAVETRGAAPVAAGPVRPQPSALVAVSAPAPVTDAPPDARVQLRERAQRSGARVTLGRVRCERRCRVELRVNGSSRTFTATGTTALTVQAARVRGARRASVSVSVDGLRLLAATVRL